MKVCTKIIWEASINIITGEIERDIIEYGYELLENVDHGEFIGLSNKRKNLIWNKDNNCKYFKRRFFAPILKKIYCRYCKYWKNRL